MSKKFLTNIDLGGNQLITARVQTSTSSFTATTSGSGKGQLYYDTTLNALRVYNGTSWDTINTGSSGGAVTSVNSLTGALAVLGTASQINITNSSPSITISLPTVLTGLFSVTASNFFGSATFASNSASLNGVAPSAYALLSSANFTTASIGGNRITTVADKFTAHTAAVTSSELAGIISDETGSGSLVFNTSPTFAGTVNLGASVATGSVSYATIAGTAGAVTGATSTNTNSTYVVRDANGRSQFTDPSAAQDAATKNYVDTVAQGLNAHDAVLVATISNLGATYANGTADASSGSGIGATLTSSANATLTIDTVALTTNDRVLVKNQTTGLQNGIYYVSASGSGSTPWVLTRAEDSNNSIAGEMANGDFVFVVSGSTQSGTGWVLNSASPTGTPARSIKIGTDTVTYTQFSGQGTYIAGNGISISGNTFSVNATSTGGVQALAGGVSILKPTNSGLITDATGLYIGAGTGFALSGTTLNYSSGSTSQTATGVTGGAYTYATQKQVATITGNGSVTSFLINHNFNTRDVNVRVYQTSATPDTQYADVEVDITRSAASAVTVAFASNVANGDTYNVVITG